MDRLGRQCCHCPFSFRIWCPPHWHHGPFGFHICLHHQVSDSGGLVVGPHHLVVVHEQIQCIPTRRDKRRHDPYGFRPASPSPCPSFGGKLYGHTSTFLLHAIQKWRLGGKRRFRRSPAVHDASPSATGTTASLLRWPSKTGFPRLRHAATV